MSGDVSFEGAVVLVHAHPDDEVFATGAATIAAKWAGAPVHLRLECRRRSARIWTGVWRGSV